MGLTSRGVISFLLISFGLAWAGILIAYFGLGMSLSDPLVQLPIAFSPAIAAVTVRRWVTREGFRDAGLAPRLKSARWYYLVAWAGPVLVLAAIVATAAALGIYRPDLSSTELPDPATILVSLAMPVLLVPVFWGEEFGWRSYLQQRVSRRPVQAAVITGVIWAAWHYPLAFTDYVEYGNPVLGILTWTPGTVLKAIILAWLFLRTGSVWVACLAHAGNNLIVGQFAVLLLEEQAGISVLTVDLLELVPLGLICGWILLTGQLTTRNAGYPHPEVNNERVRTA